jgi:hypothetical protein
VTVNRAVAAGVAATLVALAFVLVQRSPRLTGSNSQITNSLVDVAVPGSGGVRCQGREVIPAGTSGVRVFTGGGAPIGPIVLTIGRPDPAGRLRFVAGGRFGPSPAGTKEITISPRIRRTVPGALVCIANRGTRTATFAGNLTSASLGANPLLQRLDDDARLDWLSEPRSWASLAGTVARRAGLVKASWIGTWTLWAAMVALAAIAAASLILVRREAGR